MPQISQTGCMPCIPLNVSTGAAGEAVARILCIVLNSRQESLWPFENKLVCKTRRPLTLEPIIEDKVLITTTCKHGDAHPSMHPDVLLSVSKRKAKHLSPALIANLPSSTTRTIAGQLREICSFE
jgi:hypothetical protein